MRIKKMLSQSRRDFKAIFECEHCGDEIEIGGYDDDNFHQNVIPNFTCGSCDKKAPDDYKPRKTKYESWVIV